jgi:hypothetical protein
LGDGSGRNHIFIAQGGSNTVRDSYFFGSKNGAASSYGVESNVGGFNLIENNMFNEVVSPILPGSVMGDVYAYNYSINHNRSDNPGWNMPGPVWAHDAGNMFNLSEGNSGTGTVMDNIHGTIHLNTFFRNHWRGPDPGKTINTQVIELSAYARFMNVIGNVIGEAGYHTIYESIGPSGPNCSLTIFILNWQGTGCQGVTDARVSASLMRWGNYDVVNNAVRFVSAEVPSGDAFRPNPVPASQVLPNSFYLSAQPNAWWTTPWGTPHWPPVGPDVTGGTVTSGSGVASTLGGHVYKIPARLCYENTSSTGLVKNFDGAVCYPASSGNTTPPAPPTGLKIQ